MAATTKKIKTWGDLAEALVAHYRAIGEPEKIPSDGFDNWVAQAWEGPVSEDDFSEWVVAWEETFRGEH